MSHRFASIAREMGELLRRVAISTNIKEREDFSCTLLDPSGRLVVNAPHIRSTSARWACASASWWPGARWRRATVAVTNHPACGGSHLPDVTLAAPVHVDGLPARVCACGPTTPRSAASGPARCARQRARCREGVSSRRPC